MTEQHITPENLLGYAVMSLGFMALWMARLHYKHRNDEHVNFFKFTVFEWLWGSVKTYLVSLGILAIFNNTLNWLFVR